MSSQKAEMRQRGEACVYVNSAKSNAELRQKLTLVKEAKDAIDSTLRTNIDTQDPNAQNAPSASRRKRSRLPDEMQSEDSDSSADDGFLQPTPLAVQDAAYADNVDDDVEDLGFRIGRMRLGERIGGLYRPRIADEIMSSLEGFPTRGPSNASVPVVITSEDGFSKPGPYFTAASIDCFFSQHSSKDSLVEYIPSRGIADKLLSRYWTSVHPVARVLHRPSFAHRYETLWENIDNGDAVTPSLAALVCAVLFSAVVSMSETQVLETCQVSRSSLKEQLKSGVEAAIGRSQLLKSTRLEPLQAFVAYLLSMCIDEVSRALSVLTGMLVRQAECMGLHRDPSEYGFSPTECQVRRLVWYQICYLDLKTSEIQGPRPFIHHDGYTTKLPLEIPLPSPTSSGVTPTWNDMIFSMIRFECQEMQRKCQVLRDRVDMKKTSLTKALSKIEAFRVSMDAKYGPFLNSASPSAMQRLAHQVMKLFTNLLYLITLHRYMNSVTYRVPDRLRQIVLSKGTDALEAAVELETSEDLKEWSWYSGSYQQYHAAFLLLVEVFTYPMRREANRIWRCLDFIFAEVLVHVQPLNTGTHGPTLQDIIAHRDTKARYILTLLCQRMRAYHKAKGLKNPVQFDDSMILITPQKEGDNSNPHMPLNFAHGEPQAELPPAAEQTTSGIEISVEDPSNFPERPDPVMQHLPVNFSGPPDMSWNAAPQGLEYTTNTWVSSSRSISPWIDNQANDVGSDPNAGLHTGYYHSYAPSPTTHNSSLDSHSNEGNHQGHEIDSNMLEIDWNLWDTMFPPQVNDGHLDYSDDSMWQSYNSFNGMT
ncbi:hypothetical protein N7456_001728 [Penicillium angulare]|uniref:Xylanolytic transcriptional activator regulatory domain-containing protein n=1 Tax=Penicillium angulare TaxID=116970 RepID=A0A9W9G729_9EURO|nr:hypothetical protein N7456_001728 [Penicillium angulare]